MEIHSAQFVKSSPSLKVCPHAGMPEYAFAGRSNVGKSSLLNRLVNIKSLAKTSSTPGKTIHINHYLVNDSWYLVDLPGYGYARTGKETRKAIPDIISEYLLHRSTLSCLFILIDCRHEPLSTDLDFINWAGSNHVPMALVFTKTDKLSETALIRNIENYKRYLLETWEELPIIFATSSLRNTGREHILEFIEKSNRLFTS